MYKPSYVSFSQIMTYVGCPEHYLFRYVLGIKSPPAKARTRGKVFHETLADHFNQKRGDGRGYSASEAQNLYAQHLNLGLEEYELELAQTAALVDKDYLEKEKELTKEDLLRAGARAVEAYFASSQSVTQVSGTRQKEINIPTPLEKSISPDLVEQEFILETNQDIAIKGYIDLTDTNGVIHETKTAQKSQSIQEIARDPQLAIYNIGYKKLTGKAPTGFSKDFVIFGKRDARVQRYEIRKPDIDPDSMLRYIWNVLKAIQNDIWYCVHPANSWVCSKDWCGYYKLHQELRKVGFERMMAKYTGHEKVEIIKKAETKHYVQRTPTNREPVAAAHSGGR